MFQNVYHALLRITSFIVLYGTVIIHIISTLQLQHVRIFWGIFKVAVSFLRTITAVKNSRYQGTIPYLPFAAQYLFRGSQSFS